MKIMDSTMMFQIPFSTKEVSMVEVVVQEEEVVVVADQMYVWLSKRRKIESGTLGP